MASRVQIPNGWRMVRLGDLATEVNERANGESDAEVYSVTKYDGFVRSLDYFGRQVFSRDTNNYKVVRTRDFAYATIHLDEGSLGMLRDVDAALISPMYTVFRVDARSADPNFLFPLMKLPNMVNRYKRIGEGSIHRRKSISFERLSRLPVLLPPLPEQGAIAAVLDTIDDAIERAEAVVVATERLRDALLHELLTHGVPGWHTAWKEAPGIGTIPASWEVVRLGEVAEVAMGQSPPGNHCNRTGQGVPLLNGPTEYGSRHPFPIQWTTDPRKKANVGSLLFCVRGATAGRLNWADRDYAIGRGVAALTHRSGPLYQRFLRAIVDYRLPALLTFVTGSTFPNLSYEQITQLRVPGTPLSEQRATAAVLDCVDEAIDRGRSQTDGLRSLKASAADALLTGRVRVRGQITKQEGAIS